MKGKLINKGNIFITGLLLITIGCDVVQRDLDPNIKSQSIDMYVAPNKSAIIDVQKVFSNYSAVNFPSTNSSVKYYNDRYVEYSLNGTNTTSFNFNVQTNDGLTIPVKVKVNSISDNTTCDQSKPFTYAKITNDSKLVVNLYNNPEFCGWDPKAPGFDISMAMGKSGDIEQNVTGVSSVLCSCGAEGNTAIFTYIPPAGFTGQVKFSYYLGVFDSGLDLTAINGFYDPKNFKYFSAHDVIIDVVSQ